MLFWQSLLLGFSIAAPVGPIGILCIQTTARHGRRAGLLTGLGAAAADAVYGAVAACGLTAATSALAGTSAWLKPAGGLFLLWLGLRTWLAPPPEAAPPMPAAHRSFARTFLLTLTNPITMLAFTAMFGTLGAAGTPAVVVAGVFAGSMAWWLLLTAVVGAVRMNQARLSWLNGLSGMVLAGFGVSALLLR
jgi:threonine/homoserine/homoserine lactone efflux protein